MSKLVSKPTDYAELLLDTLSKIITKNPDIWSPENVIDSHIKNLKKLIRESAIVPSENQESICGGLKDALNTKL